MVQGGRLSPVCYNIGSVTQTIWNCISDSFQWADDEVEIVSGTTESEAIDKAIIAATNMEEWFETVGLTLNDEKTEMISFGFEAPPILVAGQNVI